ncbi:MAG TPA: hypothetical protein VM536_07045 [Chloroflexia bacterium]|nr:hypothetical protein [Chloroflexia bacterium]
MIMVRTVFQTKWGKAEAVVASMAATLRHNPEAAEHKLTLLTDLSGEFHTVVMQGQWETLGAWEQFRHRMFSSPEFRENRQDELMVSGRQEFYTIEAAL